MGGGRRGSKFAHLALVGRDWGRQGLLKALPGREPALLPDAPALRRDEGMPTNSAISLNSAASARSRDRLLDSLLICTFCSFCTSSIKYSQSVPVPCWHINQASQTSRAGELAEPTNMGNMVEDQREIDHLTPHLMLLVDVVRLCMSSGLGLFRDEGSSKHT